MVWVRLRFRILPSTVKPMKQTVAVVGLGYVGLPLAVLAKEKGHEVIGLDINAEKITAINAGQIPLKDDRLAEDLKKYPIQATADASTVAKADVVIIAVPTPVTEDKMPDLQPLISAIEMVAPHMHVGQLLIVESTINPGVMSEVVVPVLERSGVATDAKGQEENVVHVLHCPERVNPGDSTWSVRNIPRVIGGYTKTGVTKGKAFYETIVEGEVVAMNSVMEAEACKILENTFRDINIAFINEMAKSFAKLDIDIMNVIKGASTKPFAFMPHYPGNGVGGHCISVDPYYMIEKARQVGFDHEFLKLAREINDSMPAYTVDLLEQGMQDLKLDAAIVAMLGLAYKKDIDDVRESPALEVLHILETKRFAVKVFDPFVPTKSNVQSLDIALKGANIVMLTTNHTAFVEALTPQLLQQHGVKMVIDGKNALDGDAIAAAGILYYGVGRKRLPRHNQ